jgi:hypothetical protein
MLRTSLIISVLFFSACNLLDSSSPKDKNKTNVSYSFGTKALSTVNKITILSDTLVFFKWSVLR